MSKSKLITLFSLFFTTFFIATTDTLIAQNQGVSVSSKKSKAIERINDYLNEIKTLRADFL